jgi:hypothetical protein
VSGGVNADRSRLLSWNCRPCDRESLFLGLCSQMPRKSATFAGLKYRKPKMASNGFPRLTHPVFRRRLPVQHIAWTASTTKMDGLPPCSPAAARQLATQLSLNYLSTPKDHFRPSRFYSHFQLVSRLCIAVLTYTSGLSSL